MPVAAVVVALLAVLPSSTASADAVQPQRPDRDDLRALSGLGIPEGSVVLTNAYVEGFVERATPATGLLDGRAPYTYPDLLARADTLLRDAQDFFAHPHQARAFLDEHGVDYVAVATRGTWSLGTSNVFRSRTHVMALDRDRRLELLLDLPDLRVYRVLDAP